MVKWLIALFSLLGAFYLSVSYRYGDPGWVLELRAREAAAQVSDDGYDLRSLSLLNRAVIQIKENYVDPERVNERKMVGAALEEVQRTVAELIVEVERDSEGVPHTATVRVGKVERVFDLRDVGNLWQMSFKFKDILTFVQKNLKHHKKLRNIEYAAINGMLSTLDPHSVLMRPIDYREMKLSTRGKFGGLGIVISIRDGDLTVINPIEDTPASRAGLKAGDHIVQIGLDSTINMSLSDAVNLLRGAPNTKIDIRVARKGWKKPRKFTLTRANIKVKSVAYKQLSGGIGLVKIRNFQHTTNDELGAAFKALGGAKRMKGLVLDLRGNPGGLLDQAIKVANRFIDDGTLVTTVGYGAKLREPKMATSAGTWGGPLVVLIDGSSASASEIVAGALKNHERALLIGQRSFGKGSVQVIYDNKDDSALKLTIAQYLTPGDLSIQSVGITPDIEAQAAIFSDDATDVFDDEKRGGGEGDLPAHLEHESAKISEAETPSFVVRYLRDEALQKRIEKHPNDLFVDFEVALARDLIAASTHSTRGGMLTDAAEVLSVRTAGEEARISAALEGKGVDWAELDPKVWGLVEGAPAGAVVLGSNLPSHTVKAGQTITLEGHVNNTGTRPYERLWGVLRSENSAFDGRELLFGNVLPGQARRWTVDVEVSKAALSRQDEVRLELHEAKGQLPSTMPIKLTVAQLPRPRFAIVARLDDHEQGNGDGLLQVGEVSALLITVRNVGDGPSFGVLGVLQHERGLEEGRAVFIKRGRVKADALAVGEETTLRFAFKVKPDFRPGKGLRSLPLELTVMDGDIRVSTTERLLLPVVAADVGVQAFKVQLKPKVGDTITLLGLPAEGSTPVALTEAVSADARMGDWLRVPAGDHSYGWVHSDAVVTGGQGAGTLRPAEPTGPAVIRLNERTIETETRAEAMTLSGEVSAQGVIQDLLVFVNGKKVFFKTSEPEARTLRFSARVPLEEGVNRVTVVAREVDEGTARHTIIVHRAKAEMAEKSP